MTLEQFEQSNYDTCLMVANKSVFLAERQEGKYSVFLYQVYGFYVEIFYLKKYSHISGFRAFDNVKRLTQYFDKINTPLKVQR